MSKKRISKKGTSLKYSGNVRLTTSLGGHILSTKLYHNSGALPLFRFLGSCLAGNFNTAGRLRPFKIKLRVNGNTEPYEEYDKSKMEDATDFIPVSAAPSLILTESKNDCSCKVLFNFVFPYSRLQCSGANMVCLYGVDATDSEEFCASYELIRTIEVNGEPKYVWDPIEIGDNAETNKILAIEWSMTISNK